MKSTIHLTKDELEKIHNGETVEVESFVFGSSGVNGIVKICGPDSDADTSKARPWVHKSE